jgi:hypothetical protein
VCANLPRWRDLERAKRRLLFELNLLGRGEDFLSAEPPLTFQFLLGTVENPVITGHAKGVMLQLVLRMKGDYLLDRNRVLANLRAEIAAGDS